MFLPRPHEPAIRRKVSLLRGTLMLAALVASLGSEGAITAARALAPSPCAVPDNGFGTADLPPLGCSYVSLTPLHIIDGLPPGTQIDIDGVISTFTNVVRSPGGSLGGETENFDSMLAMDLVGTGSLVGFNRSIAVPILSQCDAGPRVLATPAQSFPHDWMTLHGQVVGDPDFDLLRITAGGGFGLPSPGHTTLTQAGPSWSVLSFFDITYRIDFVGAPGGALAGRSGSTTGTIRMQAGLPGATPISGGTWGGLKAIYR
jgi:hypothetical protein